MIKTSLFRAEEGRPVAIPLFGPADSYFEKVASPQLLPDVVQYIENLRPQNDSQYVLVNSLGAGEWWGSNTNSDLFSEASLIHAPEDWTGAPLIDKTRAKTWPYGYPTFYNAHCFCHHRNKFPEKAVGFVELASWNPRMKRVESVLRLDYDKCQMFGGTYAWDRIKAGGYPDVSMGTRVNFDLCSICTDWGLYHKASQTFDPKKHRYVGEAILAFHKRLKAKNGIGIRGLSVTRKDYCQDMKTMPNRILPDGRKVFVYNPFPRFFDISMVFVGADKTAKVMMKIAEEARKLSIPAALMSAKWGYKDPLKEEDHTEKLDDGLEEDEAGELKTSSVSSPQKCLSRVLTLTDKNPDLKVMMGPSDKKYDTRHFWAVDSRGKVHDPTRSDYKRYGEGKPLNIRANTKALDAIRSKTASVQDSLLKAAFLGKRAKQKKGKIIKDVPSHFIPGAISAVSKSEPDLPEEVLDGLADSPLKNTLATSTGMGVVLKPKEFQRIVLIRMGKKPLADSLDERGEVFPETEESTPLGLRSRDFLAPLAKLLLPLLLSRSAFGPNLGVRVTICSHRPEGKVLRAPSHSEELLNKIGAAYNGYRKELLDIVPDVPVLLHNTMFEEEELQKLASAQVENLFTPLTFSYLNNAFMDEMGKCVNTV